MKSPNLRLAVCLAGLLMTLCAAAQPQSPLLAAAQGAKDLDFPQEPSSLGLFSSPKLALYKPEGNGPFPAIVLQHQCGGLRNGRWQNMAMLGWAKEAVGRGYVALLVDSLGPRGVATVCMGVQGGVNLPRGVRDGLQAAAHLATLPYVDPSRIVFAGYSWGATLGVLASGKAYGQALAPAGRYRAVVAFYPGCFTVRPPGGRPYEPVANDIDRPLLVLMGGADIETPPSDCLARLEPLKAAGAPVAWHVYPEATHCFDCENLDGFRKTDFRGNAVQYHFSRSATQDAAERMFGFFATVFADVPGEPR